MAFFLNSVFIFVLLLSSATVVQSQCTNCGPSVSVISIPRPCYGNNCNPCYGPSCNPCFGSSCNPCYGPSCGNNAIVIPQFSGSSCCGPNNFSCCSPFWRRFYGK